MATQDRRGLNIVRGPGRWGSWAALAVVMLGGCDDAEPTATADAQAVDARGADARAVDLGPTDGGGGADARRGDAGVPDAEVDAALPAPYPAPGAWRPAHGPGLGGDEFDPDQLYVECGVMDVGPDDRFQHRNLVVPFDGYIMMPWAPEFGLVGGLTFFDVSTPCVPTVAGHTVTDKMRETHTAGFTQIDGRRYTATAWMQLPLAGGLLFWDVTDPTAPTIVSTLPLPGFRYPDAYARIMFATAWQGPYVFASGADNGVYVVDVRDPTAPVLLTQHVFDPVLRAAQLGVVGDLLVVTAAEGARTVMLDVSEPAAPQPIPGGDFLTRDAEGEPRDGYFASVAGGYVYYARKEAGGGVMVYDIHDPEHPVLAGEHVSDGNGGYVFVKQGHAFVGESNFAAIYDLSDLSNIVEVARMHLQGDLDTATPLGQYVVLSVDDKADDGRGSVVVPWQATRDVVPPAVNWVYPPDGAVIGPQSRVGVTFDELVEPVSVFEGSVRFYRVPEGAALGPAGTLPEETAHLGRVAGWLSVQEGTVNFFPQAPLEAGATYVLEVPAGGVTDVSGSALEVPFAARFTVRGGR